jgi:hypothetical protein
MSTIKGQKIQAAGNWKSLQISSQLRDQGLLGIEELTDYSMVKVKKNPKSKLAEVKKATAKSPTPDTVSQQIPAKETRTPFLSPQNLAFNNLYRNVLRVPRKDGTAVVQQCLLNCCRYSG